MILFYVNKSNICQDNNAALTDYLKLKLVAYPVVFSLTDLIALDEGLNPKRYLDML